MNNQINEQMTYIVPLKREKEELEEKLEILGKEYEELEARLRE